MGGRGANLGPGVQQINIRSKTGGLNISTVEENDPESLIHNFLFNNLKKNNISVRKSTDNINRNHGDRLLRCEKQLKSLSSEYSKLLNETTSNNNNLRFSFTEMNPGTNGYIQYKAINQVNPKTNKSENVLWQRICLNKNTLNTDNYSGKIDSIKSGWSAPIDNKNIKISTLTHEMGHAVSFAIVSKKMKQDNVPLTKFNLIVDDYLKDIKDEIVEYAHKKYGIDPNEENDVEVSRYGETNEAEWFAECFANGKLSSSPKIISKALLECVDKYNK